MVLLGDILDQDERRDVLDALVRFVQGGRTGSRLKSLRNHPSDPRRAWISSTLETILIGKLEP